MRYTKHTDISMSGSEQTISNKEDRDMTAVRSARSSQTIETKAIIRQAKKDIDNGRDWKDVLEEIEQADAKKDLRDRMDGVQMAKIRKSIIDYA